MSRQLTSLTKPLNLIFILNFYAVSPVGYNACRHIVWLLYVLEEKGLKMKIRTQHTTMGSFFGHSLLLHGALPFLPEHRPPKPARQTLQAAPSSFPCPFELNIAC